MADNSLMLEVDEELRAQQLRAFWAKWGQWLIGLALAAVIATATGVAWHNHRDAQLQAQTDRLLAILHTDKPDAKALADLHATANQPLQGIVGLDLAAVQEQSGDLKAAAQTYASLTAAAGQNATIQDLATLNEVRLGLAQQEEVGTLLAKVEPLTVDQNAFHASARELKGLLLRQQGKNKEANAVFQALTDDAEAPNTLRQRARALINYEMPDAAK